MTYEEKDFCSLIAEIRKLESKDARLTKRISRSWDSSQLPKQFMDGLLREYTEFLEGTRIPLEVVKKSNKEITLKGFWYLNGTKDEVRVVIGSAEELIEFLSHYIESYIAWVKDNVGNIKFAAKRKQYTYTKDQGKIRVVFIKPPKDWVPNGGNRIITISSFSKGWRAETKEEQAREVAKKVLHWIVENKQWPDAIVLRELGVT